MKSAVIIDDNCEAASDIEKCLSEAGYAVRGIVSYGNGGITAVKAMDPDLVVYRMHGEDHEASCRAAGEIKRELNLPVLVVADQENDFAFPAGTPGPDAFLVKPVNSVELLMSASIALEAYRTRRRLCESESLFKAVFAQAAVGISLISGKGEWIRVNKKLCDVFSYTEEELEGRPCTGIVDFDPAGSAGYAELLSGTRKSLWLIGSYTNRYGVRGWVRFNATAVHVPELGDAVIVCVIEDITGQQLAMEKLAASVSEKETLLKEIHHRVKNNMQIISSLIDLQTGNEDQRVREMAATCKRRIRSMALVHEKLYRSGRFSSVNYRDYLESLVADLHQSGMVPDGIELVMDVRELYFDIDTAISCALIVNELVTNSLKYAFPHGTGRIDISLHEESGGSCVLTVRDNGVGIPADVDPYNTLSLGLQLVKELAGQLRGSAVMSREHGTECSISFKVKEMP